MHLIVDSTLNLDKLDKLIKGKNNIIVLYWAKWCSFCVQFKPDWEKFVKQSKIATCEFESENASLSNSENHEVHGFPTIKLYTNGKVILFEGQRSIENLNKFIDDNTSKKNLEGGSKKTKKNTKPKTTKSTKTTKVSSPKPTADKKVPKKKTSAKKSSTKK